MKVLVACERSGVVRTAFREYGHEAYSCDLVPADDASPHHFLGDVRDFIFGRQWDLMIAHPPCTYLANSGVRWLYRSRRVIDEERWEKMLAAAKFFEELLYAPVPKICIENPLMHKHATSSICKRYTQRIQPYQFGHGEVKTTCLWLKGLPRLKPTMPVNGRARHVHFLPPGADRAKKRSETFWGVGDAMAEQWGAL